MPRMSSVPESARVLGWTLSVLLFGLLPIAGCDDDDDDDESADDMTVDGRPQDNTGQACESANDCYAGVTSDAGVSGDVLCLDRVVDGYCTHLCASDDDCCAVEGECDDGLDQVCSPFESTGMNMCFLSCEDDDVRAGLAMGDGGMPYDGADDATEFCRRFGGIELICRSSGGGRDNRKVCVPGGGDCNALDYRDDDCRGCLTDACCGAAAACDADDDCRALLTCTRACDASDDACMDACYDASPGGRSVHESLRLCMSGSCAETCPYDAP